MTVTVIIPTYKPGASFRRLMKKLSTQTYPIEKIIIMNTEQQYWKDALIQDVRQVEVHHITKAEFDHGKTRAMGAAMANSDILVFLLRMQFLQMTWLWSIWCRHFKTSVSLLHTEDRFQIQIANS